MDSEASSFETSEMVATFLASTPLLTESWRLCSHANATAPGGFAAARTGDVCHVAFSGVQKLGGFEPGCGGLVALDGSAHPIFSGFKGQADEPPMVHAGFLHLFLSVYENPTFQNQMFEIMKECKSVVFSGHSIGGTIASLASLWLLSNLHSLSSPLASVLCVTFGSPLLGNASLGRAVLQERWGGQFWHLVTRNDVVPRLLLAPLDPFVPQLHSLLRYWHSSMAFPERSFTSPWLSGDTRLSDREKSDMFHFVLAHVEAFGRSNPESDKAPFWPFGNYMFCGIDGAICVDDAAAVVKLLHLLFATGSPDSCVEDHLGYEDAVRNVSMQFLKRRDCGVSKNMEHNKSSYEVGITLALQSTGISDHEPIATLARECLKMARRMGRTPNLNSANLAIGLSKITPLRAQIEWYKATCDDLIGYYDTFKQRGASIRDSKVNMNRVKLARFWDDLIRKIETNQLPHDFHRRAKWVNASQFYKLLVEPLDIAEYYRSGIHRRNGHYRTHGRHRRYEIFDRWWSDRMIGEEENIQRSKFASLTQDSCFWARVEEAREWLDNVRFERDARKLTLLIENIDEFDKYAKKMVDMKEVSVDVVAKNSSYGLWVEEWKDLKSQLKQQQQFSTQFYGFFGGESSVP